MCEQFIGRSAEPFRLDVLWPLAERLERFGLAGFGWGAAWLRPEGGLASYRSTLAFRDDPEAARIGAIETTSLLVHLRRPSKLSTLQPPDAQPFDDPGGRFALSHNGDLREYRRARERYRAEGRIHGRADSEVGERWLEDAWPADADTDPDAVPATLAALHDTFGGQANLAVLTHLGDAVHYAGNGENPVFSFRLDSIGVASTALYSIDRSLFAYAAKGATDRALVRLHATVGLDASGRPVARREPPVHA
jgi:hypothetical protein